MGGSQSVKLDATDQHLVELAVALGERLRLAKQSVTTAESCTGGWIAKVLTDVAGSSDWFGSAVVSYSNASKHRLLGVDTATLDTLGAVSAATVDAMAAGALRSSDADWSVAVSGIAGPDGGTEEKPVGLVWFAWAGPGQLEHECKIFGGDRETVRRHTVQWALRGLLLRV